MKKSKRKVRKPAPQKKWGKWISFKKKQPKHNQKVLYTFSGLDVAVGVFHIYSNDEVQKKALRKGWAYFPFQYGRVPATHWMPLPEAPKRDF